MKKNIVFFIIVSMVVSVAYAQDEREVQQLFHSKRNYDIYYQVSDDLVHVVTDVEILGVTTIGGRQFLECYSESFGKLSRDERSFIDFHAIRAIHPNKTFVKTIYNKET